MKTLTKYRILVAALALGCTACAGYAFFARRNADELQAGLDKANQRAAASARQADSAAQALASLQKQAGDGSLDQLKTVNVIAAFSKQAAACEAVKKQLHLSEKQDAHS